MHNNVPLGFEKTDKQKKISKIANREPSWKSEMYKPSPVKVIKYVDGKKVED